MNNPVLVRLTTGEDIVAILEGPLTSSGHVHTDGDYLLKKATRMQVQQDPQGRPALALMAYPPFTPENEETPIAISGRHIMYVAALDKRIMDNHKKATSSLILPSGGTGLIQSI